MSENGKGSDRRPTAIPKEEAEKNYERALGKFIPWYERRTLPADSDEDIPRKNCGE